MFLRNLLYAIFLLATVAPGGSFHAAAAGGLWLATGAGFDPAGLDAWQAATSAPLASLDAAGPRLRLFLDEGGHDGSARFEAGWSVAAPWFSGAVLGGLEARRQDGWKDGRTRLTPVIATELEAAGDRGGLAASALLRPAFGEAWLEVRPWLDLGNCRRLGAVAAAAPLQHEATFRLGYSAAATASSCRPSGSCSSAASSASPAAATAGRSARSPGSILASPSDPAPGKQSGDQRQGDAEPKIAGDLMGADISRVEAERDAQR